MNEYDDDTIVASGTKDKDKTTHHPMWSVIILNDDYTPMEFVVAVLQKYFNMSEDQAILITLDIHKTGEGVAGVFTRDIAETKAAIITTLATQNEHPLQATIRPN